ncbi:MAG: preprotein translocase subunit SecE [Caldisericales bacterium]|nr:preprotein translocase subunit SecE [Caldisericales bacterium]
MNKLHTNFFKDVWYEMNNKVTWPTWKRLVKATTVVIVFIMIWAVILGAFDSVFSSFQSWLAQDYYDPVALQNGEVKKFESQQKLEEWMESQRKAGVKGYVPEGQENNGSTTPGQPTPPVPIPPPDGGNNK